MREVSSTDSRLSRARFSRWNSACSSPMPTVDDPPRRARCRHAAPGNRGVRQGRRGRRSRRRFEPPHVGQVALARAPRPHDHASRVRPIGPAVDQLDRRPRWSGRRGSPPPPAPAGAARSRTSWRGAAVMERSAPSGRRAEPPPEWPGVRGKHRSGDTPSARSGRSRRSPRRSAPQRARPRSRTGS